MMLRNSHVFAFAVLLVSSVCWAEDLLELDNPALTTCLAQCPSGGPDQPDSNIQANSCQRDCKVVYGHEVAGPAQPPSSESSNDASLPIVGYGDPKLTGWPSGSQGPPGYDDSADTHNLNSALNMTSAQAASPVGSLASKLPSGSPMSAPLVDNSAATHDPSVKNPSPGGSPPAPVQAPPAPVQAPPISSAPAPAHAHAPALHPDVGVGTDRSALKL